MLIFRCHLSVANSLKIELCSFVNHAEQDYDKAVLILNALLDAGGADEQHPLARLVEALGVFMSDYEQRQAFF